MFNWFKKQNIHEGQVKCEECKHWVDLSDTQVIRKKIMVRGALFDYIDVKSIYFCPLHQKKYDKEDHTGKKVKYLKKIPEHWIDVDEKGREIKLKPRKKEQRND